MRPSRDGVGERVPRRRCPPRAVLTIRSAGLAWRQHARRRSARRSRASSAGGRRGSRLGATSSSIVGTSSTPSWRARSALTYGSQATMLHAEGVRALRDEHADAAEPDDAERLAVELDALPLVTVPLARRGGRGRPAGCCAPARAAAPSCARRSRARSSCGAFTTITPRRVAASTSTLSRPIPARPTTTRSSPASSTSAVTWVALRITSAAAPRTASSSSVG